LNVYGAAGQGKEQLLADLQALAKLAGILVLSANMKAFAKNYSGFIKDLTRQLASQLQIDNYALSLEQLLDRPQPKTVWILLDHFDAVLDRTELDPQFGIDFFNQLNALKNLTCCFLLCVTEKPYQKYHLYAEQIHRLSRLDLAVDKLTALTRGECEQELQRRVLGLLDEHFRLLLSAVYQHSFPYAFLEYPYN